MIGGFPSAPSHEWELVNRPLSLEEIKSTLSAMGGLKAPGPNALHALFFQNQWSVVRNCVCKFVVDIFNDPQRIYDVYQTFIYLISKVDHPE